MKQTVFFSIALTLAIAPNPTLTTGASIQLDRATLKPAIELAQQSPPPQRLQFARGAVGTVVEGSVVRGTRTIYLLRARGGQTMTLNITSREQNAVFDVQAPNGIYLQEEATSWSGELPQSGDYSVIVTGTRGNARYRLDVTIR